ncbi:MAG: flagellar protein [Sulfurimonas sp.]|nr:flagellar protein [Sulfurimonas sp.]
MIKFLLIFFLFLVNSFALEISLSGAKENFQNYSTLHIKEKNKFLCQKQTDDFDKTIGIVCAFSTKPTKKIQKIQNDFFEIKTEIKKETFFLIIKPFKNIKLIPVIYNLTQDDTTYNANVKLSKHWMVIGYDKELPHIKKQKYNHNTINFPFTLDKTMIPFVGGLDIKGNPVYIKEVQDVKEFIKVKKLYKKQKYNQCLEKIDNILDKYPDTLFKAEFSHYKILASNKLEMYDEIIDLSKIFLREYSSNDNIAEVLSLTAKAHYKLAQSTSANYFFDRLINEHSDSVYAKWGLIYMGDMQSESGSLTQAVKYYKKALKETQNIDVATTAAFKLATYYINFGDKLKAAEYIKKIVKVKPSYFIKEYELAKETMYQFAEVQEYNSAAAIAMSLINNIEKDHDDVEKLLRDKGVWLSKTDAKTDALKALNEYLEKFEYGAYEDEVVIAKDSLFFETNDDNLSVKITQFNELIDIYGDDTIGEKAIYEKAKLLEKNKMFRDVLNFEDELLSIDDTKYQNVQDIIYNSAVGFMKQSLQNQKCNDVLAISDKYNVILSDEWDDGIYHCAMKGADYVLAKRTASKNIKSNNLDFKKKWLYRYIKIDFATGNYSDVVDASKELIALIQDEENSKYLDVHRYMFDTYQRLEQDDNMLSAIVKLQKVFGIVYNDIERYIAVMGVGSSKKDNTIIIKYAKYVMEIQEKSNSYAQSPYVEFTLYGAYIDIKDFNKALDVIESLNSVELKTKDKARQQYLLGSVYTKLWRDSDAIKAYDEVIKLDPASAWAELARSAKSMSQ